MTKKIKLESETDFDFQKVQIENFNTMLISIQKRLETMYKRLNNLQLQYKDLNNKHLYEIKRCNKKIKNE